jgi:hypothetical protein
MSPQAPRHFRKTMLSGTVGSFERADAEFCKPLLAS